MLPSAFVSVASLDFGVFGGCHKKETRAVFTGIGKSCSVEGIGSSEGVIAPSWHQYGTKCKIGLVRIDASC